MAFNTKYTAAFTQLVGPSKLKTDYNIYFKKDGYSGAVTTLIFGGDALTAKIINNEDSILGIKEKKISISFLSDLDLSELQLAKPNEWKVEITSTVNFTISTNFVGYLNPTTGQTDYVDGLRPIRLEAIDGLTNLKNIDFVDDSSVYYEGLSSVFDVIRLCLKKIGTDLNLNIINNTFGSGHSTADTSEALKQRYIDLDLFRGTKEPLDTYKVLSQICTTEKCRLYQEGGEWWIENVTEKIIDGQVKWRKYLLSDGSRTAYGTLDLRTSAVFDSLSYKPMAGGSTSANKPIKFAKVEHKLADFKNQLLNRDLRVWTGTEFANWTRNGTGVTRVGDGTSGNPYGVKIAGFVNKSKDSKSIYQTIILGTSAMGTAASALQKNITFSGQAYTQDVESAVVRCYLQIVTLDYGIFLFGLNDAGEWVRNGAEIALKNSDVNNHSKKTAVNWNVTSKRVGDVSVFTSTGAVIPWESNINRVEVVVHLLQAVGQLEPYAGETQSSKVWYKNINLGLVNSDTNLNIKQINFKANNDNYAPIDETYEAVYGDYADGGNLSTLKNSDGSVTSLWTSPTESVARNFHNIGAADLLNVRRETQKVYDGEIWGNILYRHCLTMAGFTRKGYVVAWEYNFGSSFTTVRVIEHQTNQAIDVKKTGLLSDGTEIDLVGETVPSPSIGHQKGVLGRPTWQTINVADNWIKQVIGGIQGRNSDDDGFNVVWNSITADDTFDFGAMVRQGSVMRIAKDETTTEIGNDDSITKILGQFGVLNSDNFLGKISSDNLTSNINYVLPNYQVSGVNVLNDYNYLINKPTTFPAEAHTHTFASLTSKPTTISGYGITDFETNWQYLWVDRLTNFVEFGSDVGILGGLGVSNALFVGGAFYDKDSSAGSANQVLMPVSGGVAWTLIDWSVIANKPTTFTPSTINLSGDVTGSGQNSISTSIADTTVTGKVLTGLNIGGGTIASTDSLIVALGKLQNQLNAVSGAVVFQSTWNASTNTPTLANGVGTKGHYYIVSTNGTTNIDGTNDWKQKDWIIYDGTAWQKIDNTDSVSSVNGFQGAVSLTTDNVSEGSTNLYWTNGRGDARYPQLSGSYSNPTWLNSLAWSKITGTPTTISGYGITDFNSTFDTRFASKIATEVEFGSNIIVQGFRTEENAFFNANVVLSGDILDKNYSAGTAGKILTPASGGGVAWSDIAWSAIIGTPTTFTPTTHTHTIGEVTDLSTALAGKQPLSADLTAIDDLSGTTGLLKKTATNTWVLDTTTYLTQSVANGLYQSVISGTNGKIVKFTSGSTIGDSVMSESSGTISVAGGLNTTLRANLATSSGIATVGQGLSNANVEFYIAPSRSADGESKLFFAGDSTNDDGLMIYRGGGIDGGSGLMSKGTGDFAFWNSDAADFRFYTSYTTKVIIKANGRVGIGTATPSEILDVVGNINFTGVLKPSGTAPSATRQVLMSNGTTAMQYSNIVVSDISDFSSSVLGQVLTGYTVGSNTALSSSNNVLTAFQNVQGQLNAKAATLSGTAGYLLKYTSGSTAGNSVISESSGLISIQSGSLGATAGDYRYYLSLQSINTNDSALKFWEQRNANGSDWITTTTYIQKQIDSTAMAYVAFNPIGALAGLSIGTGFTPTERIRIDGDGKIGINTTTPTVDFDLVGSFKVSGTAKYAYFANNLNGSNPSMSEGGAMGWNLTAGDGEFAFVNRKGGGSVGGFTFSDWNGTILTRLITIGGNGVTTFENTVQFNAIASCSVAPTSAAHLTNKAYVDSLSFLKRGENVKTISLTNITLSGTQTVSGYALTVGELCLVIGQTTAANNGVYVVASGAWTRSTLNDSDAEIRGAYHYITNGTYANSRYGNTNGSTITVGTTAITYSIDFGAETDPVFTASAAYNVTTGKISNWDTAFANYADKNRTVTINTTTSRITVNGGGAVAQAIGTNPNFTLDLATTGVSAGTYLSVTVDSYGRVTAGTTAISISSVTSLQATLDGKQTIDPNLTAISALSTIGFIKRTGSGTYAIDTASYLPLAGGTMTGSLTLRYSVRIGGTSNDDDNLFFGKSALLNRTTGLYNTTIGASAGSGVTTGSYNTLLGWTGGSSITTGSKNVIIGSGNTGITTGSNNVILGREVTGLSSSLLNNIIIADGQGNRRINVGSSGLVGFGLTSPAYRVDVSGDVNVTGMYRLNGSIGADHTFLKSNGTTQEFSLLTVGEISDIADNYLSITTASTTYAVKSDAVLYGTYDGERGFKLYHDADKLNSAALFFANQDTGIVGIHAYGLSGSTVTEYGIQIDGDGKVYHKKVDGTRARFLTTDDSLTGGGGSATWSGGRVSSDIKIGSGLSIYFGSYIGTDQPNESQYFGKIAGGLQSSKVFSANVTGMLVENGTVGGHLYLGALGNMYLKAAKYFLGDVEIDMSTYASGRYLRATSSTKAEWVI